MDAIQVTARLTIREGRLEEFKELAAQCMRSVRERDSGTLQYDWSFEVYGSPSAELVKAAAGLAPKIYSPFQSI